MDIVWLQDMSIEGWQDQPRKSTEIDKAAQQQSRLGKTCQIRCATAQLHASSIGLPAANASAVFSTVAQSHPVTNSHKTCGSVDDQSTQSIRRPVAGGECNEKEKKSRG